LKLQYDELLSNFAFNFNLRRYAEKADENADEKVDKITKVWRCRLNR